jgi:5-methylcytosine-specific restriction protein A
MSKPRLKALRTRLAGPAKGSGWQPDAKRGNRRERGYGPEWDRLRKLAMDRDNGLCQPCYKRGRITIGTQVDHEIPKAQGGTDELANLQTICEPCHRAKTARESMAGRM